MEKRMAKGKSDPNWKEKVKEWESSKKNPKVWCQENQIPYTTLRGWRNRLKKSNHHSLKLPNADFIELKDQPQSNPGIILEFYGVKIQLMREFDKVVLKECLHCLKDVLC